MQVLHSSFGKSKKRIENVVAKIIDYGEFSKNEFKPGL
jgi:hypothetical protein